MPKSAITLIATLILALSLPPAIVAQAQPATASPVAERAANDFTSYQMDVMLETETRKLSGTQDIVWDNTTGRDQDTLYFRLYPNADYYGDAKTVVRNVTVDGVPVTTSAGNDPTVLAVPLGRSVAADDTATITLDFTTVVPLGSTGTFGVFQLDPARGVWSLADWYPILAGWEADRNDWYLARPTAFGDPTFSETATYEVALTMPSGLELVGTGTASVARSTPAGLVTQIVTTGPVRDFALTLLPTHDATGTSNNLVQTEQTVGKVQTGPSAPFKVRITLLADEAIPGLETAILDAVTAALPVYAGWLGGLPEGELDITSASLAGANGVSWSGLIWLNLGTIVADGVLSDQERMGLTFVVTHEVGHQWIGGVIGSNSNDHGFMTEGLTNALAVDVLRELEGGEAAIAYLQGYVAGGYAALTRDGRDGIVDTPITDDTNGVIRGLVVYGKAALGFEAIRQDMGEAAFLRGIARYAQEYRFGISTPANLQGVLLESAGPNDEVATLWAFWFEQDTATIADVEAVFAGAGG